MNLFPHRSPRHGCLRSGSRPSGSFLFVLLALLSFASSASAQTTLVIDGVTRTSNGSGGYTYNTWKPILGFSGSQFTDTSGNLMDPVYDQQTGQGDSDFVSSSGNSGFFVQFGQINGVDYLAFRIMMGEYKTTGNIVNIRLGFDGNFDGVADMFLGLSQQSNQYGIVFQATGSGTNDSPSTTTWGNAFYPTTHVGTLNANGNALLVDSTTFSNVAIGDGVNQDSQGGQGTVLPDNRATYYPGWVTQQEASANKISLDAMISYAVPLADINSALAQIGKNIVVTPDLLMRWIAVTATQNNAVNQDAYGTDKTGFSSTYASFLPYMDAYGRPVPEPSTYGLLLGAGLAGACYWRRRRGLAAHALAG